MLQNSECYKTANFTKQRIYETANFCQNSILCKKRYFVNAIFCNIRRFFRIRYFVNKLFYLSDSEVIPNPPKKIYYDLSKNSQEHSL